MKKIPQCTWRWSGKRIQKTMIWIPRQLTASKPGEGADTIAGGNPPSNWRWYMHRTPGWCQVYLQVHRRGEWSVRLQEHQRDDEMIKRVWMMPNECLNVYQSSSNTYQIVYWMASQETLTEWHPTPNMAECPYIRIEYEDYQKPSTEGTNWDS